MFGMPIEKIKIKWSNTAQKSICNILIYIYYSLEEELYALFKLMITFLWHYNIIPLIIQVKYV